jgi:hypothetical protein
VSVFRIPGIDQRVTIVGRTGSGKTQGGAYILSQAPFDLIPYVIMDFKREKLFNEIPGIRELSPDKVDYRELNQPGLFIMRPTLRQSEEVESFLWTVWEHENIGLFIDEGYMIGKSQAFVACLTQGRSKNIPMITLTQRPRFISGFVFSEADYLMIFQLSKPEDRKTVQDYVDQDISGRLPKHHSYWYDVGDDKLVLLRPVPDREWIKSTIQGKIDALNKVQRSKQFV